MLHGQSVCITKKIGKDAYADDHLSSDVLDLNHVVSDVSLVVAGSNSHIVVINLREKG